MKTIELCTTTYEKVDFAAERREARYAEYIKHSETRKANRAKRAACEAKLHDCRNIMIAGIIIAIAFAVAPTVSEVLMQYLAFIFSMAV